jgi:UDP-N-acetyl-D-mannosaminuronic acid dehydrogenase
MSTFSKDVAIIGTGRVGLPLGLSMCEAGIAAVGIDKDPAIIEKVSNKEMPFSENGCDDLIKKVDFRVYEQMAKAEECENIIITVGTPLSAHIETDLSQVSKVILSLCKYLKPGHNVILRSTVAPGTTLYAKRLIEKETHLSVGSDIYLSFCPERIAEGKALREIHELPQIVGCEDEESYRLAESLFKKLTGDILRANYISAELVKLFNNISRYIHFAVANQFAIIADNFNADIYDILYMSNYKYPRGVIPQPGFTAGTCLRKDFGMLNEHIPYSDLLLSAWKTNEFLPKFLLEGLLKRTPVSGKKIAVLGYTFKRDSDDVRDSLVPKLIRYIEREVPASVAVHEPHLGRIIDGEQANSPLYEAVSDADVIFIGVNHRVFQEGFAEIRAAAKDTAFFVDIWNVSGTQKIFFRKNEECLS